MIFYSGILFYCVPARFLFCPRFVDVYGTKSLLDDRCKNVDQYMFDFVDILLVCFENKNWNPMTWMADRNLGCIGREIAKLRQNKNQKGSQYNMSTWSIEWEREVECSAVFECQDWPVWWQPLEVRRESCAEHSSPAQKSEIK